MSYLASVTGVVDVNIIDGWSCTMVDMKKMDKMKLIARSSSRAIMEQDFFFRHPPEKSQYPNLPWENFTSLAIEAIHYKANEMKSKEDYYHVWEVTTFISNVIKHLKKGQFKTENGLDSTLHKIASLHFQSRITMDGVEQRLTRVEAMMLIESMDATTPVDLNVIDLFNQKSTITYVTSEIREITNG